MKAELFSSDFFISILIFLTSLLIITFYYQNLQSDVYENNLRNDMYLKAINTGSLLATTSGYPNGWNRTNVKVPGLYDSGKFNLTKFEELKNIDYNQARILMGTGTYNIFISLKNETGGVIEKPGVIYSYGTPIVNAEQIVVVKRLGVVNLQGNATKVVMEVILWL